MARRATVNDRGVTLSRSATSRNVRRYLGGPTTCRWTYTSRESWFCRADRRREKQAVFEILTWVRRVPTSGSAIRVGRLRSGLCPRPSKPLKVCFRLAFRPTGSWVRAHPPSKRLAGISHPRKISGAVSGRARQGMGFRREYVSTAPMNKYVHELSGGMAAARIASPRSLRLESLAIRSRPLSSSTILHSTRPCHHQRAFAGPGFLQMERRDSRNLFGLLLPASTKHFEMLTARWCLGLSGPGRLRQVCASADEGRGLTRARSQISPRSYRHRAMGRSPQPNIEFIGGRRQPELSTGMTYSQ